MERFAQPGERGLVFAGAEGRHLAPIQLPANLEHCVRQG
jgi:hypothetical protein